MSAHEDTPRLTPTQRLHEVTMAALARRPAEPEHTVGLTLNAKGDVQIEVTGRGPDLDALAAAVAAKFDWLRTQYRRAEHVEPTDADEALKQARKVAAIQANRAKGGPK